MQHRKYESCYQRIFRSVGEFMIRIRVPATSANIGPGFDCLGIAFNLYNTFEVEEIENALLIEGCSEKYKNENNLVVVSMKKCFEKIGYKCRGIKLNMHCNLPVSRGLGSSAACILGGVMAANEIAGGVLKRNEILDIASEIEGHPDNLAPALYGGMTVSIMDNGKVYTEKLKLNDELAFYALIPDFYLSTKKSRGVLPKVVDYSDAVFNVGRTALLISALSSGNHEMLGTACQDKLHEIYRGELINNYSDIKLKCRELYALGVFLSGAGPTIMAIVHEENNRFYEKINDYLLTLENKWEVKQLSVDYKGAVVEL